MVTSYDGEQALRYVEKEARIAWTALQRCRKDAKALERAGVRDTSSWDYLRRSAEIAAALLHEHLQVRAILNGRKPR
jgi:hypothetical protein